MAIMRKEAYAMDLQKLFQKVNIQSQLRSIAGVFFNEDRINSTDYKPSYQRNYVWDADKASYFIESIFIGTDVPPLIYFQNDGLTEIIDGRQRYETILNFVQGKLKLKKSGLPKLGGLKNSMNKKDMLIAVSLWSDGTRRLVMLIGKIFQICARIFKVQIM